MKGVVWILVLFGLLGVAYLLYEDIYAVTDGGDATTFEAVDKAKDIADTVNERRSDLMDKINKATK